MGVKFSNLHDLIVVEKWKREIQNRASTSSSTSTINNVEAMLQKLSKEMIAMKRKMGKTGSSFQQPYQDIPLRKHEGKPLQFSST